jgi:hypothetical protein
VAIVVLVVDGHAGFPSRVGGDDSATEPFTGTWLPTWLGIATVVAMALVVVVHLRHLTAAAARQRVWHGVHLLMALGMADMFAPTRTSVVPAGVSEAVFAVAAVAVGCFAVSEWASGRRFGVLWAVTMLDLAAMVYMFAMPGHRLKWLTVLLVAWLAAEATGWATGRLAARVERGGLGGPDPDSSSARVSAAVAAIAAARAAADGGGGGLPDAAVPADVLRETAAPGSIAPGSIAPESVAPESIAPGSIAPESIASDSVVQDSAAGDLAHSGLLRVSLCVMSLAMAYMLVAMQFGMSAVGGMSHMPGMGNMPGM